MSAITPAAAAATVKQYHKKEFPSTSAQQSQTKQKQGVPEKSQ